MSERLHDAPGLVRVLIALICGVATGLAFAPVGWWPLILVGVAGLTVVTLAAKRGIVGVAGLGLVYGLGLTGTTLNWMRAIFVEAMVGLVIAVALFYLVLALAIRLASRLAWWPLVAAGCWSVLEFTICRWPFNGFGWVRLGYAMIDSPLAGAYPLIGVAGVSFLTAVAGQTIAWLLVARAGVLRRIVMVVLTAALCTAVAAAGSLAPAGWPVTEPTKSGDGTVAPASLDVGWVQGGAPGGGVYGLGPERTITTNETKGTVQLAAAAAAGTLAQPDFVVWPEEGTDLDPAHDPPTKALVDQAVDAVDRPILVGTVLNGPGPDARQTASLWWEPGGGVTATYIKRGIVPFGEWIPGRSFLLPLFPVLRYVGAQSVPGTEPGVLDVTLSDGRPLKLGTMVCYDLAFDNVAYDTTKNGAQLLVVQSSNAMYQGTGQIQQQFAMTRVRAAELRREILVVTTSGVSGYIAADGSVLWQDSDPATAYGVQQMPLRQGTTLAVVFAQPLELGLVIASLACLVLALFRRRSGIMAKDRARS